jgi:hypothetical protein
LTQDRLKSIIQESARLCGLFLKVDIFSWWENMVKL